MVEKGDAMLLKVMDAALLLEMESLRRRLSCAVAIKLMRFTIEEIREEYNLGDQKFEEDALRNSMKPLIE